MVTDHIRDVENASSSLAYPTKQHSRQKEAFLGPLFSFWYDYTTNGLKVSEIAQKRPKNGFFKVHSDKRWDNDTENAIKSHKYGAAHTNFSKKFCFLKKSLYFCIKQVDFFRKATIYL